MIRSTASSLALLLVASPLAFVGCTVEIGDAATGGTSSLGVTGGASAIGGAGGSTVVVGGASSAAGGSSATVSGSLTVIGGGSAVGGASATGGASAIVSATGGASAIVSATGGASAIVSATGGASAIVSATGGASAIVSATGGASATVVTGGASSVDQVGGSSATGGTSAAATTAAPVCTEVTKFAGGSVETDVTLTAACSPYIIKDDIVISSNATLTIEPGVTLKFNVDTGLVMGYSTSAKLVAVGTAANPIVFTSSASTPGAGDWSGLKMWSGTMTGTTISYASVKYCGATHSACVAGSDVKAGRVTIDHVTFDNVGPGANAISENSDSNFAITSCTFKNIPSTPTQQYAISVPATSFSGIDSTNAFPDGAMIELTGDTLNVTSTWKNPGTPIAVTSSIYLDGTPSPVLDIAAGSVFKFAAGEKFGVGYKGGNLRVNGTATAPVTFTSLNLAPAPGDWQGIDVYDQATLNYAVISYGGEYYGDIVVRRDTTKVDVQNSAINQSLTYGIAIDCGSTPTVTNLNNTFTGNIEGDVGPGPDGATCQ